MKKNIFFLLIILTCLFSFYPASAGPEQVELLPLHKWGYHNVGGWGFYALNGEFSWFAIVLHNPTNNAFTVSLPTEADVNHLSRHKIVNTAYKVMPFGNTEFFHDNREKVYFTGNLTLPKQSTYAIYMDITDMQPYSGQWDVPAFLNVRISDQTQSVSKNIEGVLARDGYDEVPTKLVIVVAGAPDLQATSFCRDYSASDKKISFAYTLKNTAHDAIRLELASTLAVEGLDKTIPVSYISCTTGGGKSCMKRLNKSNNSIYINSMETMEFRGEATSSRPLSNPDFKIRTSMRYDYNGKTLIPFLIGETTTSCSSVPPVPTTVTVTPAVTASSQVPGSNAVVSEGICRNYDRNTGKVTFRYGIRNTTSMVVPVELAMTLAIEGQSSTIEIRNTTCVSSGTNCTSRIENGYLKLNPKETVQIFGEADLQKIPAKTDFYIKTSLRYRYGNDLVPVLIGTTTENCTAAPTPQDPTITVAPVITATPQVPGSYAVVSEGICRNYDRNTGKVTFRYGIRNTTSMVVPVELAMTLAIEGQSSTIEIRNTTCVSSGTNCTSRIENGYLKLNPFETIQIFGEADLRPMPAKADFYIKTSLRYKNGNDFVPVLIGYATESCSAAPTPQDPTITTAPVVTSTPTPVPDTQLKTVNFCKTSDSRGKKVCFVYALRNESKVTIPVELATTMAVQGYQRTVPIRYLKCSSDSGSSCAGRIRNGYLTLNPGETAELRGEITLPAIPANPNFTIRTSLRYNYNGQKLIPFYVGTTGNTCSAAHSAESAASAEIQEDVFTASFTLINEENTDKTLSSGTILLRDKPVSDYIGSAIFGAIDGSAVSEHSVIFTNGESFIMPPQSAADILLSFPVDPENNDVSNNDIKWNYNIVGDIDNSQANESVSKSQPLPETVSDSELQFYFVNDGQEYNVIPVFPEK